MLTIHHLSKTYGISTILQDITFSLQSGERIGLIGPNGCGKTTLLRLITGEEKPDSGSISFTPANLRVGYLAQGAHFSPEETLAQYLVRMEGDLPALSHRLEKLAAELATQPNQPNAQREYDVVLNALERAAEGAGRAPAVLASLGLGDVPPDQMITTLSGGQKTRLSLAGVILANPQLLLLDEPTNHLDLEMLEWLEDWLLASPAGVLVVSHDRAFLDRVASRICELDTNTHQIRSYPGNYTAYLEQKLAEREKQWQEYGDQQVEIAHLKSAARHLRGIAQFRKGGKADTGDKFAKGFFANRGLETIRRAKQIEARLEHLMTDEHIDKPRDNWQMKLEFAPSSSSGRDVLVMEDLSVGYGERVLLRDLTHTLRYGARAALVGANGAGKTTLLRTITGAIEPLGGSVRLGSQVHAGIMAQEQEDLNPTLTPLETIQRQAVFSETAARTFLHQFLFGGDDVFLPVGSLSYGERARLSLACLVAQGCNFLMLDEPLNHLDIPSRARFEQALGQFEGTVLAVVHDRYFIEGFASEIWQLDGDHLIYRALN